MGINVAILPVDIKDLPISPRFTPYDFLSRCKFSTRTTRQLMVVCACVCVCVVIPFILGVRFVDVPAGVTQEEGHTENFSTLLLRSRLP